MRKTKKEHLSSPKCVSWKLDFVVIILCRDLPVFMPSGAFWPRDENSIFCVNWAAEIGVK